MEQESQRDDPAENIVQFNDALRRHRSPVPIDQATTEPTIAEEEVDDPPPDAA